MEMKKALWTVTEVGKLLRVDDTTVRRWIKDGSLDAITLPHAGDRCAYRIKDETVQAIMRGELNLFRKYPGQKERAKHVTGKH